MPLHQRVIIHADLDAFFAAAEVRRTPELRGKPVIVGGRPGGRGVVAAASYEARAFGVRSAMPVSRAERLCPDAIFLRGDHEYYRELSHEFRAILHRFTPLVQALSVDEACLDMTGNVQRNIVALQRMAREIKETVSRELGLVVSLGVASSRLVAKIAASEGKPDGMEIVEPGREPLYLAFMPIEKMPGIGPKATEKLRTQGIRSLGTLAQSPVSVIEPIFGKRAPEMIARARGIDPRPVDPEGGPAKSIGHERTFSEDLRSMDDIRHELYQLAERTGRDLRRKDLQGKVVNIKLRYDDFTTVNKQRSLPHHTNAHQDIAPIACALVDELLDQRHGPIRLLGVRMTSLRPAVLQLSLFDDQTRKQHQLNRALDEVAERYGQAMVGARSVRIPARASDLKQIV